MHETSTESDGAPWVCPGWPGGPEPLPVVHLDGTNDIHRSWIMKELFGEAAGHHAAD